MRIKHNIFTMLCALLGLCCVSNNLFAQAEAKKTQVVPVPAAVAPVAVAPAAVAPAAVSPNKAENPRLQKLYNTKNDSLAKLNGLTARLEEARKTKNVEEEAKLIPVIESVKALLLKIDTEIKQAKASHSKQVSAQMTYNVESQKIKVCENNVAKYQAEVNELLKRFETPIKSVSRPAGSTVQTPPVVQTPQVSAERQAVRKSLNSLAWKLFRMSGTQPVCPYGAAIVLNILREGANGTTAAEIEKFMGTKIHGTQYFSEMISDSGQENKPLKIYTLGALQKGSEFLPEFKEFIQQTRNIHDEVQFGYSDFAMNPQKEVDELNKKFNTWTNGEIQKVFTEISPQTQAVFANVTLFDAKWKKAFDHTTPGDFFLNDGNVQKLPMMQGTMFAKYQKSQTGNYEVLILPYRNNTSMVIILPKDANTLKQIQTNVSIYNENWLMKSIQESEKKWCAVTLPQFKSAGQMDLLPIFSQLGLRETFSRKANFSKMTGKDSVFISQFLQDVVIEVNEAGTKATAATAASVILKSMPRKPEVKVEINRPFIYAIVDDLESAEDHVILFMGIMTGNLKENKNE